MIKRINSIKSDHLGYNFFFDKNHAWAKQINTSNLYINDKKRGKFGLDNLAQIYNWQHVYIIYNK